jgi:hypothetical protein
MFGMEQPAEELAAEFDELVAWLLRGFSAKELAELLTSYLEDSTPHAAAAAGLKLALLRSERRSGSLHPFPPGTFVGTGPAPAEV